MGLKEWVIRKIVEKEAKKMLDKLNGKKTYITMAVIIGMGALVAYNTHCGEATNMCKAFEIPPWAFSLL